MWLLKKKKNLNRYKICVMCPAKSVRTDRYEVLYTYIYYLFHIYIFFFMTGAPRTKVRPLNDNLRLFFITSGIRVAKLSSVMGIISSKPSLM